MSAAPQSKAIKLSAHTEVTASNSASIDTSISIVDISINLVLNRSPQRLKITLPTIPAAPNSNSTKVAAFSLMLPTWRINGSM